MAKYDIFYCGWMENAVCPKLLLFLPFVGRNRRKTRSFADIKNHVYAWNHEFYWKNKNNSLRSLATKKGRHEWEFHFAFIARLKLFSQMMSHLRWRFWAERFSNDWFWPDILLLKISVRLVVPIRTFRWPKGNFLDYRRIDKKFP